MQKVILLIGGTGFIGSEILKQFDNSFDYPGRQKQGDRQIIVFTSQSEDSLRKKSFYRELKKSGFRFIKVDLLDFKETKEVFEELKKENILIETIIQSSQFANHPVERPWLSEKYSYLGFEPVLTSNVINALKFLNLVNNLDQYIYLSGLGVEEEENQKYPWNKAKLFCEELIKKVSQEFSNFRYTILRPSWVYGSKDRSMSKFVFLIKLLGIFPMIGSGTNKVNPIWVSDLAKIIINSIQEKEAFNKTIEVGSSQITMNELVENIFKTLEKEPRIISQPKFFLKAIACFLQFLPFSPISPGLIDFVTMESRLGAPEKEILGIKINSLRTGLLKSKILL